MSLFKIICGVCSIAGLLVSIFTAGKVVKIVHTFNRGNRDDHSRVINKGSGSIYHGSHARRDIIIAKRIPPVSYCIRREPELHLIQRIEDGCKFDLLNMCISETYIYRMLFEKYLNRYYAKDENVLFRHRGYSRTYLLSKVAEYEKEEWLCKESSELCEDILGELHFDTAISYNNLAGVYEEQGEYRKAEELYEKALRIRERVLGEEHLSTAMSYNNLAGVYEEQGEYRKAEELYEKSLQIMEKVLGEEHPATAISYNNLAGVYEEQGEYRKAEELYEKSLQIMEKVLGEEHPATATSYNNLAVVYKEQGEYRKAEELYEKALRIRERVLGEECPNDQYESYGQYTQYQYRIEIGINNKSSNDEIISIIEEYYKGR